MPWQTLGQDHIIARLQPALERGRAAHAYLLTGPPRCGKLTLAREVAQAVNCLAGPGAPCGECGQCQRIAAGRHADIRLVNIEFSRQVEGRETVSAITIGAIRELERTVNLNPFEGARTVIIIDGAGAMTPEAANALLKTLEEPPPGVLFLLLADDEEALLTTIRSRCQTLPLLPMPRRDLLEYLMQQTGPRRPAGYGSRGGSAMPSVPRLSGLGHQCAARPAATGSAAGRPGAAARNRRRRAGRPFRLRHRGCNIIQRQPPGGPRTAIAMAALVARPPANQEPRPRISAQRRPVATPTRPGRRANHAANRRLHPPPPNHHDRVRRQRQPPPGAGNAAAECDVRGGWRLKYPLDPVLPSVRHRLIIADDMRKGRRADMPIPESQLGRWSHHGPQDASIKTHEAIRRVLEAYQWPSGMTYDFFSARFVPEQYQHQRRQRR